MPTISNAPRASPTAIESASSCWTSPRGAPSSACTTSSSILSPPSTRAWSSSESASREDPSACRAIEWAADSVSEVPSAAAIVCSCPVSVSSPNRRKSNRWRPPDDRGRHLVRLGGGQHEPHARRRFLEDLQQGVERLAGEPLRLVDDVDLLAALHGRGGRLLPQLARVLDAAVAGGVDLDDVQVRAFTDRDALGTHAARLGRGALLAVDHLGQDASGGGLARPPGPAEQERVVQAPLADGAGQRADRRGLVPGPPAGSAAGTAGTGPGAVSRPPLTPPWPRAAHPDTRVKDVAVHPLSTTDDSGASRRGSSSQASLRHPSSSPYGCFLPDLTGFEV